MTEDKEKHLLEKISSCLEKRDLDACVDEAIAWAKELGITPQRLLKWSKIQLDAKQHVQGYVLALAAADGLDEKAAAYNNAGAASSSMNDLETAEKLYRLAIKYDPKLAGAYSNLGNLLKDLGKTDEAEEQYRLAIKSDPNLAAAHNNYANLLRIKGRFGEAEREVRTALDLDPLNPYILGTLGDILADDTWLDESEKEYKRALEHSDKMEDSARSEIHNNLGWVYAQKKLFYNAKDEFFKARTIDPKNIKAIRNLRLIERVEAPSEITQDQKTISFLLVLPLLLSLYLFWIDKLKETSFTALLMFFIATILFVLLYKSIGKFSAGLKGVEFEMSTEHRLSPAQSVEQITRFER